ncbi:reverse transcriptase, partial [Phytophthora megakarya]
ITAAISASKAGKATGPDRLGNDWYRDYSDLLVPILHILLNAWYSEGVFPPSFLEANIFCLKKSGNQHDALNYRPLAERIHHNQNGFVPGRTIHETLHIFEAAQKTINEGGEQDDALVMLLDFMKAYDSLSRSFLLKTLRRHGYPAKLIEAVRLLHDGTTVSFMANGFTSRKVNVTSGIRQGCPLAPLLFILALDPLYRELERDTGMKGVFLRSEGGEVEVRVAGYADDTAVYLDSAAQVVAMLAITDAFGAASGLQLNHHKTLVIALRRNGPTHVICLPPPLKWLTSDQYGRYLGIQVGSRSDPEPTWHKTIQQLEARLFIASQKTTTVEQRSLIASAVIIPKLTYIGQHAWPSTRTMNLVGKKIKNYVWHGCFATEINGSRAWLDADLAALPRTDGGLAVPDLRIELMAMAATAVAKWSFGGRVEHIVGDILMADKALQSIPAIFLNTNAVAVPSTRFREETQCGQLGRR